MSSAGIQKLFCGIYSTFKCSFDEFVGEKVVSPSYSSAILAPPPHPFSFKVIIDKYDPVAIYFVVLSSSLYTIFVFPFNRNSSGQEGMAKHT